jgi:acyl-coenzyme A thioesterase 13
MDANQKERLGALFGAAGFERALPGMEMLSAGNGNVTVRLPVTPPVANINNTLHGGAIATLVDLVGTLAIITWDRQGRSGVTTDLNVSYFAPGRVGENVLARATVLKGGKTLAFVSVDVVREADGTLCSQGRMTKFMGP